MYTCIGFLEPKFSGFFRRFLLKNGRVSYAISHPRYNTVFYEILPCDLNIVLCTVANVYPEMLRFSIGRSYQILV